MPLHLLLNSSLILLLGSCADISQSEVVGKTRDDTALEKLIDKLADMEIEAESSLGPYTGVGSNEITRKIVSFGERAVPILIDRLKDGNLNQTIYCVKCLRDLKAKHAEQAILRLQKEMKERKRFANMKRDLTLEVQIKFFLERMASW